MTPRTKAVSELEANGYRFKRHGANHDIFCNSEIGCIIPLKRHDFDEKDLQYIRKEIKQNQRERG